jgi:osmotically-inducible protein OsmY
MQSILIRQRRSIMDSDLRIRDDVVDELDFEPSVDNKAIGVAVKDGVVTLSGHVPTYAQKIAAEQAAQRVKGVRAVAIDIEVRLPGDAKRSDDEIAERAVNILRWSTGVGDKVKVVVENGWVKINGEVEYYYQKQAAERAIRQLSGVIAVSNLITIKPGVRPSDVKERIGKALQRNAELETAAIKVDVSGSTVTLSGRVKAWHERKLAEDAAWAIPGVTAVHDNITM